MKFNKDNFSFKELKVGDYVDEDVVMDLMNELPPATFRSSCMQVGEPYDHRYDDKDDRWRPTFSTFKKVDENTYEYCGNCFKGETEERGEQPQYVESTKSRNTSYSGSVNSINESKESNRILVIYKDGTEDTLEVDNSMITSIIEKDPDIEFWDYDVGQRYDPKGNKNYFDFDVVIKPYDESEYEDIITAESVEELENKMNSNEYIEYWDYKTPGRLIESKDTSYYDGPFIPVRDCADKILELVEEGIVDPSDLCLQLVKYMNEDDLKDFMKIYEYDDYFDESDDEKDECLTEASNMIRYHYTYYDEDKQESCDDYIDIPEGEDFDDYVDDYLDITRSEPINEAKKNPAYNNIRKVAKAMNWNMPMFVDPSAYGYLTWKKITDDQVEEIKKKTGLDVKLARSGRLIVPRSDDKEVQESFKIKRLEEDYVNNWDFVYELEKALPRNLRYKEVDVIDNNLYWVAQAPFEKEELRGFLYAIDEYGFDNVYVILRDDSSYNFDKDLQSGKMYKIDKDGNIDLVVNDSIVQDDEIEESFKEYYR